MNITVNTKEVIDAVRGIADKQLPFATALALTRTAQDAQKEIQRQLPQRFVIRNAFVQKGIRITKATKRELVATVSSRDDFMVLQEEGGAKRPRGRSIAIPQGVKRNKREIVTRANRPRQVMQKPRVFEATIRGVHGIWQRTTKKRLPLRLLYSLQPTVPVRPRFGFQDTVRDLAQSRFERHFTLAFEQAVRTAR